MGGRRGDFQHVFDLAQIRGKAPQLQKWLNAKFVAKLQNSFVALLETRQIDWLIRRADRRAGQPFAAELRQSLHVTADFVQSRATLRVVLNGPFAKANGALDGQSKFRNIFTQRLQRTIRLAVFMDFTHPRLD